MINTKKILDRCLGKSRKEYKCKNCGTEYDTLTNLRCPNCNKSYIKSLNKQSKSQRACEDNLDESSQFQ